MDAVISGIVHMDNIAAGNNLIQPDNAKTRQATRYGVRLFREYCVQHGVDTIHNLPARDIAAMLKGFYGQARTKDGQRFSVNSLIAIRYAISRYYRSSMVHRKVDIVKDSVFSDANETFRAVLKELETDTRGTTCQKELLMVDMDDRRKLRHYFEHAISTPRGLLQKVWYDLMLRVGRRGRESQRLLSKNSFRIAKTADGRQYIYQTDEPDAGVILEIPGDPLCPVKTLKFYMGRLNPACRALFQRPKEHIYEQDTCWYVNSPVGKNMLATMMSTISKCARLSRIYTNVRIRATTYSPADGKGCCTDSAESSTESPKVQETLNFKVPEKKPTEIAPKPVQVSQNSHIIKQLNAPIVQACLSVVSSNSLISSNSLSSVTNAGSFVNRLFPITFANVPKNELLNGQAVSLNTAPVFTLNSPIMSLSTPTVSLNTPKISEEPPARNCAFCKKDLKSGMVLKSSEAGKEFCSTECLGKWLALQPKDELHSTSGTDQNHNKEITNGILPDCSYNNKIQKLLTLCSSANLLIPFPSICKDFSSASVSSSENKVVTNGITKDDSRSSSPLLIVPDDVYPEALLETVDSDPDNIDEESEMDESERKDLEMCDQGTMCQPTTTSCAISCKPVLKSQGIQTDFSTYFSDSLFRNNNFYPKYCVNSTCCSNDDDDDDESLDHSEINGGPLQILEDVQDTDSLWMSVDECDEEEAADVEPVELPVEPDYVSPVNALVKCEETFIPEPLSNTYSHRGRTTKRTTWDEIAQRSKLQTLWGVKVFREWLQSKNCRRDFERLEAVPLAGTLEEFYENLTKPDGEEYSVSTMHTIRASISRYLTLPPQSKPFSIIRDREFKRANEAFYRRIRRLQSPRQQQPTFHYTHGRPPSALWAPHHPQTINLPQTVNIPCSGNGIMLVQLGPQ